VLSKNCLVTTRKASADEGIYKIERQSLDQVGVELKGTPINLKHGHRYDISVEPIRPSITERAGFGMLKDPLHRENIPRKTQE